MKFFQLKKNPRLKNQCNKFDGINFALGQTASKIQKLVENLCCTFENQNQKK